MRTFGINGFGRIGRTALRVWWQQQAQLELAMINTSGSMELENWAHLLKYDTNYGVFSPDVQVVVHQSKDEVSDADPVLGTMTISDETKTKTIVVTAQRDPNKLPWGEHNVSVVLESTGVFRTAEKAQQHLGNGVEYVLISAPGKGGQISSSVKGVNEFEPQVQILSNASCTTNSVAPVAFLMEQVFGVEKAVLTTIHAYTDSQNLTDNSHKDLRRARAAASNIIPTTTGAAKATTNIIPTLKGKFDGMAVRVPVLVGSLSDMVFVTKRPTSVTEVNEMLTEASKQEQWQGILAVTAEPIVSSDIVGRPESAIVDTSFTMVVQDTLVKILSWYDNEWGYCSRLIDQMAVL